jgi:hypothetical protein
MRHREELRINLNELTAYLSIVEDGSIVQYSFRLNRDRKVAELLRSVYDDDLRCIGNTMRVDTLESYRNDPTLSDMCKWMIVGMWGVPLRYGSKETQGVTV